MLEEYKTEFREMYEEIIKSENPLEVIRKYCPLFKDEGIGSLCLASHLIKYTKEKSC